MISENALESIPPHTITAIHELTHFVVERARTARRFIKKTAPPYPISNLEILEIDKNNSQEFLDQCRSLFDSGIDVGLMSEAGMPAIADPGSEIVQLARQHNYVVKPLVGPSSLFLALAASGLNGQRFSFQGYLPIKEPELRQKLRALEKEIQRTGATQIFIETPYRNSRMLESLINILNPSLRLTVAIDITCLLYTSPSPRDATLSRMPSSA